MIVRMRDLRAMNLPDNWTTISRYQRDYGFPKGRMLGRSRIWNRDEILAWIHTLPVDNTLPLPKPRRAE